MVSPETGREDVLKKRHILLELLLSKPQTKAELISNTEQSRSTIDRGIKSLQEQGCVLYKDGKYFITQIGNLSYKEYRRHRQVLQGIETASDVLEGFPSEIEFPLEFVNGVDVYEVNPKAPALALKESHRLAKEADKLVALKTTAMPALSVNLLETVSEHETSVEIVVESSVLELVVEEDDSAFLSLIHHPNSTIYQYDGELPLPIWVTKSDQNHVGVTMYNPDGFLGVMINGSEKAVSWGLSIYEDFRVQSNQYDQMREYTTN